jgi:hypothetical protein
MIIYMCRNPGGNLCYFASASRETVEQWMIEHAMEYVGGEESIRWYCPQSGRVYYLDNLDTERRLMNIYILIKGMQSRGSNQ